VKVERVGNAKHDRSCHGLVRSVLENNIAGVQTPFTRILDIQGVGFQCAKKGKQLALKVGFSNEIMIDVPRGSRSICPRRRASSSAGATCSRSGSLPRR